MSKGGLQLYWVPVLDELDIQLSLQVLYDNILINKDIPAESEVLQRNPDKRIASPTMGVLEKRRDATRYGRENILPLFKNKRDR